MADGAKLECLSEDFDLSFFRDVSLTKRSKDRGYTYFVLGYIFAVKVCAVSDNEVDLRCKSYRSMRKSESPHTVNLTVLTGEKKISASHCTFMAGASGTCAHVIGLVHTVIHYLKMGLKEMPADLSVTSLPQQWHKPRGSKIKPTSVVSMVMSKPKNSARKWKPVTAKLNEQRIEPPSKKDVSLLRSLSDTPLSYLLDREEEVDTKVGKVQLGSSVAYHLDGYKEHSTPTVSTCGTTSFPLDPPIELSEEDTCLNNVLPVTIEEARDLEQATVKQANDDTGTWFAARENRVTASQCSLIFKRKKAINEKFIKSIMNNSKFTSKQTSYEKFNEENAKREYTNINISCHVHDCGFTVNPKCSFLGATPDGKICDNGVTGILEIKCPYAARDMTLHEAVDKVNKFCLVHEGEGFTIDTTCDHYIQIQGQLLVTGAPFCDYVVYTRKATHVQRINPNLAKQKEILNKLVSFYKCHALPYLQSNVPSPSVCTPASTPKV